MGRFELNRINQHHVWRSYLEAWAVESSFVCRRNGRVFDCQPKNVAAQRYFYRVEELAGSDLAFIEGVFLAPMSPYLQRINRDWLQMINAPFKALEQLREQGGDEEKIGAVRNDLENNILEEIHGHIEQTGDKYLANLRKNDSSFFSDKEARIDFLLFLTTQYFRTSKIKANILESAAKAVKDRLGYDLEKMWNPVSYIFATSTSYSMSGDESLKLVLLNNKTVVPFITGDQPVVNTRATNVPRGEQVHELELYYPVSPSIAILVTDDMNKYPKDTVELDETSVQQFNDHIARHALNEIYGKSKSQLESISLSSH